MKFFKISNALWLSIAVLIAGSGSAGSRAPSWSSSRRSTPWPPTCPDRSSRSTRSAASCSTCSRSRSCRATTRWRSGAVANHDGYYSFSIRGQRTDAILGTSILVFDSNMTSEYSMLLNNTYPTGDIIASSCQRVQ